MAKWLRREDYRWHKYKHTSVYIVLNYEILDEIESTLERDLLERSASSKNIYTTFVALHFGSQMFKSFLQEAVNMESVLYTYKYLPANCYTQNMGYIWPR